MSVNTHLRLLVFWNLEQFTRAYTCSFGTMPVGRERVTREIDHALALLQRTYPHAAINGTALVRRFEVWGGINKYQLPLLTRRFPDAFFRQPLFVCENTRRTSPSIEQAISSRLKMPVSKAKRVLRQYFTTWTTTEAYPPKLVLRRATEHWWRTPSSTTEEMLQWMDRRAPRFVGGGAKTSRACQQKYGLNGEMKVADCQATLTALCSHMINTDAKEQSRSCWNWGSGPRGYRLNVNLPKSPSSQRPRSSTTAVVQQRPPLQLARVKAPHSTPRRRRRRRKSTHATVVQRVACSNWSLVAAAARRIRI